MIVVGVIPSRYASVRLPAKALVDLLGMPMVERVHAQVRKARSITRTVVATDDERIASVVRGFGGEAIMTSPDIRSGSDRVAAVAEKIAGDIFVNIQGDEPLIAPEMIDEAVSVVRDNADVQVGTLIRKIDSADDLLSPAIVKVAVAANGDALYFSRATIPFVRDEPDPRTWLKGRSYYKHIGIYVFRKEFLRQFTKMGEGRLELDEKLEQLRILEAGYRIRTAVTTYDSIPIDTQADVQKVIGILKSNK